MVDRIRSLIARFPENEDAIRELIRTDRGFDALCQEYADAGLELVRLARLRDPTVADQVDGLRKQRMAIEEELLTAMEGYNPV